MDYFEYTPLELGAKIKEKEIGVKEKDLEALTDAAMKDVCTGGNPRPCKKAEILSVYQKAYYGK